MHILLFPFYLAFFRFIQRKRREIKIFKEGDFEAPIGDPRGAKERNSN